ncbi:hypothetical protein EGI16_08065 [Chryseobacterium sp. G0240]|uniref:hypothetical protein n=1 Tax=Chryseobacterium sp. G0240 TaxID=2487066 RepID=UPI000F450BD3|nr:hypothetical protein [Chryseobacterium sp. G0240]ROI04615.1 hypothetical protein EGI16_08065 [Chryseobacterium sp. G0240]
MKAWTYILLFFIMITSCSGNSSSQNLTWYKNSTITNIIEDPDKPDDVVRIAIGISAQVFYLSKKSSDYNTLFEKAKQSFKRGKAFDIGIENNTNIIRQINEIKK